MNRSIHLNAEDLTILEAGEANEEFEETLLRLGISREAVGSVVARALEAEEEYPERTWWTVHLKQGPDIK